MQRILLPLVIIAAMYYGHLASVDSYSEAFGSRDQMITGADFIGNAVNCVLALRLPLGPECAFDGDFFGKPMVGHMMTWTAVVSFFAAILGIVGLLPVIGRLVSVVTIIAGLLALASMGLFAFALVGTDAGVESIRWGVYLVAGAGLLTLIAGLAGLRGRD